ncbi:late secretory pathway protein AVL9 homolog [Mizuhopecten yessoensis]|uniref:Late secretory pathway protein AVL9-like n=1 Tax=Mizuhopecten yessoensis TaxID=6573 RepID=A0A210PVG1_MIZYE|nr:late secretory pathway protein AVL9 homolog [Mizuhopecten yessoensis]OWF40478.1 Late secretory pathway protein AVL9-like [Mizuhopecten yessoensis]
MAGMEVTRDSPVLHVVVIGFHHKKGCQVEFSYPPLIAGNEVDSHEVPEVWKHLPSLAIPDGAHNFTQDTIFFHLPSRDGNCTTVYGVACYRQMDACDLVNKTADVTRSTVQKSVCVLSRLPLFGLVKAKLELITHAYFEERDFTKVGLLEETYRNLTMSVTEGVRDGSRVFMGMSVRDVVCQFRHKIVLLFKLILLERRVLFCGPPVEKLCNTLLSIFSLFPGMIEFGLEEATSIGTSKKLSPTMRSTQIGSDEEEFLEIRYHSDSSQQSSPKLSLDPEIQLSIDTQISKLNVEEPNSPTITRGCDEDSGTSNPLAEKSYVSDSKTLHSSVSDDESNVTSSSVLTGEDISAITQLKSDSIKNRNSNCDKDSETLPVSNTTEDCDINEKPRELNEQTKKDQSNDLSIPNSNCDTSSELNSETSFILGMKSTEIKVPNSRSRGSSFHSSSPSPVTSPGQVVLTENTNPLANVNFITHIEAVQTGYTIQNSDSVIDMEEYSEMLEKMNSESTLKKSSNPELSVSLEGAKEGLLQHKLSDSVEELDSPESIQKIDKEDCFSWEEDRLFLSIEHELESSNKESSGEYSDNVTDADQTGLKAGKKTVSRQQSKVSEDGKADIDTSDLIEVDLVSSETSSKKSDGDKSQDDISLQDTDGKLSSPGSKAAALRNKLSSAFGTVRGKTSRLKRGGSSGQSSNNSPGDVPILEMSNSYLASRLQQDDCGFPLVIFSKGNVCHPYLSLQYYDLMQDVNIRAFVIGATNMLFKQKRHLTDVVIDTTEGHVDIHDKELQKVLSLTTADLRFADIVVKAVIEDDEEGAYFDGTEWEGGDEWLRAQFRIYLQSLLVSCKQDDVKHQEDFGMSFVQAFKTTHSYRVWTSTEHEGMKNIALGHPYHGNLGVSDIRMRLSHTMQSTERGKKINAAVSQTGKYVMQTGKVVGGALTQARSAMSSWFSSKGNKEQT